MHASSTKTSVKERASSSGPARADTSNRRSFWLGSLVMTRVPRRDARRRHDERVVAKARGSQQLAVEVRRADVRRRTPGCERRRAPRANPAHELASLTGPRRTHDEAQRVAFTGAQHGVREHPRKGGASEPVQVPMKRQRVLKEAKLGAALAARDPPTAPRLTMNQGIHGRVGNRQRPRPPPTPPPRGAAPRSACCLFCCCSSARDRRRRRPWPPCAARA